LFYIVNNPLLRKTAVKNQVLSNYKLVEGSAHVSLGEKKQHKNYEQGRKFFTINALAL
tara:strand:- start:176 stop:349 length:174 start_codon:yes stop_codon:yes gene_type:complete